MGGTSDLAGKAPGGRRLIAVVYADMVGYSRLIGLDDSGTLRRLQTLRRALIDPAIREYGGQVVQTGGDSLLVAFDSIDGAVRCAVKVQQQVPVYDGDQLADRRIRFRIGINIGDVIPHGTDLHGEGVNIAARLEAACPVGGICVSRTVRDHVHNRLSLSFEPIGELRLKNIARPVEAFVVRLDRSAESNTDRMSDGLGSIRRKAWPRTRITFAVTFMAISICAIVVGRWWLNREPVAIPKTTEIAEVAESKNVEVSSLITSARLRERPSIAVLPFQNLSKDGDQYFSDGITEDIISALGRFSNLIVAAKAASFQFKDRNLPPAALGQLLDVRYLLEGSIRRSLDRIRVNVELIEAATGRHLWSEVYDAELRNIFDVQDDISHRVVGAAAIELGRFEQIRVRAKPTENLAAYEYVLRGRERLTNLTRKENDDARDMFQHAIDLDSNYAAAYAGLGGTYFDAAVSGWTEFPEQYVERAEGLAQQALTLDPATTSAQRLLAVVHLFRRQYDLALNQIDRALEINKSDSESYAYRGVILVFAGKAHEALPWLEAALRFDPASVRAALYTGMAYYFVRRYEQAVSAFDRALVRSPGRNTQLLAHPMLAATYAEMGNNADLEKERTLIARLSPFFDAQAFSEQFGTQASRDQMMEGLRKAGFR